MLRWKILKRNFDRTYSLLVKYSSVKDSWMNLQIKVGNRLACVKLTCKRYVYRSIIVEFIRLTSCNQSNI